MWAKGDRCETGWGKQLWKGLQVALGTWTLLACSTQQPKGRMHHGSQIGKATTNQHSDTQGEIRPYGLPIIGHPHPQWNFTEISDLNRWLPTSHAHEWSAKLPYMSKWGDWGTLFAVPSDLWKSLKSITPHVTLMNHICGLGRKTSCHGNKDKSPWELGRFRWPAVPPWLSRNHATTAVGERG